MSQKLLHILLVDDDLEDIELIEDAILNLEPQVKLHKVTDGKMAMEYLETTLNQDLPDLIVLDYSMPVLTGLQVLEKINQQPRLEKIPVIILSTSSSPAHIRECKAKGAKEYFVKPSTSQELRSIAGKILRNVLS